MSKDSASHRKFVNYCYASRKVVMLTHCDIEREVRNLLANSEETHRRVSKNNQNEAEGDFKIQVTLKSTSHSLH